MLHHVKGLAYVSSELRRVPFADVANVVRRAAKMATSLACK